VAPLIPLRRLTDALDWELTGAEEADASDALEHLSELVRQYGKASWTEETCPQIAKSVTLAAAKRYMRTYEGLTQSRAGDETTAYTDLGERMLAPYLTEDEKRTVRALTGHSSIHSVQGIAWGHTPQPPAGRSRVTWTPVDYDGRPFPTGWPE